MKVVIADRCAIPVSDIFQNLNNYNGNTLLLGGIFYTIQIYSDFAGYSLIAIGVSKLFGFELMRNFAYPYFARDIKEFWKRWHISLTSWFRDYVFLPISYSMSRKISSKLIWFIKTDILIYIIGISITWLLTGLWHGGNFTFIIWGFINGFFLIVYQILKKPRSRFLGNLKISRNNIFLISLDRLLIIIIIIVSWIVFRADNISHAWAYISKIFSKSFFSIPEIKYETTIFYIVAFMIIEWVGRGHEYAIANLGLKWKRPFRYILYYIIIIIIIYYGGKEQQFIYFQF